MKKRFLAGILALCLLLTMIPMTAMAEEADAPDDPNMKVIGANMNDSVGSGSDHNENLYTEFLAPVVAASTEDGVDYTVKPQVKGLHYHLNGGNPSLGGYWVGIGIPKQEGDKYFASYTLADMTDTAKYTSNYNDGEQSATHYTDEQETPQSAAVYSTFYFGIQPNKAPGYVGVMRKKAAAPAEEEEAGGDEYDAPVVYQVDFSNVEMITLEWGFKADGYKANEIINGRDKDAERDTMWAKISGTTEGKTYSMKVTKRTETPASYASKDTEVIDTTANVTTGKTYYWSTNKWSGSNGAGATGATSHKAFTIALYEQDGTGAGRKDTEGLLAAQVQVDLAKLTIDAGEDGELYPIFEHELKEDEHFFEIIAPAQGSPAAVTETAEGSSDGNTDTENKDDENSSTPSTPAEPSESPDPEEPSTTEEPEGPQDPEQPDEPTPTPGLQKVSLYVDAREISASASDLTPFITFAERDTEDASAQAEPKAGTVQEGAKYIGADGLAFAGWAFEQDGSGDWTATATFGESATPTPPPTTPPVVIVPTSEPTESPAPTDEPTSEPTTEPTDEPTDEPTTSPTAGPTVAPPTEDGTVEVKPDVVVDEDGTAKVEIDEDTAGKLLEAAKGDDATNVTVKVEAPAQGEAPAETTVTLPAGTVEKLGTEAGVDLTIDTPAGNVTVGSGSLGGLGAGAQSVTVTVSKKAGDTVAIEVKKDGEPVEKVDMKAELPAHNLTDTTVAYLVDANGNVLKDDQGFDIILRKSTVDTKNNTVTVLLQDGSATLKLQDNKKTFADEGAMSSYAKADIDFVTSRELFAGTSDTTFSPKAPMTRAMIVTVLHRLENKPDGNGSLFPDTPSGAYYADAVVWGVSLGIVAGKGDGSFAPNENVTREDIATFIYRYAKAHGVDISAKGNTAGYNDASKVSGYAREALDWCIGAGIVYGKDGNRLDPKGLATREEVSAFLARFVRHMTKG